jgi:Anti-sigma factor NepR
MLGLRSQGEAFPGLVMTQGKEQEDRLVQQPFDERLGDDPIDAMEGAILEPHIQEQLGRVLRSFCDDLIHQPIPDKFVVLLAQLEAKQREKK